MKSRVKVSDLINKEAIKLSIFLWWIKKEKNGQIKEFIEDVTISVIRNISVMSRSLSCALSTATEAGTYTRRCPFVWNTIMKDPQSFNVFKYIFKLGTFINHLNVWQIQKDKWKIQKFVTKSLHKAYTMKWKKLSCYNEISDRQRLPNRGSHTGVTELRNNVYE